MPGTGNILVRVVTAILFVQILAAGLSSGGPTGREQEVERLRLLVEEVQPAAARLAGFPVGEPVEVAVKTRQEVKEYMIRSVRISNPDGDLTRRGRCLALLGLLPEAYDLEAGMVDLVAEQAGGLYDPFSNQFWGILNMPSHMRGSSYQKLIASHELTHALQDRVTDMVGLLDAFMENPDYEYAFRSVIEGMATIVMFAYTQDLDVDEVRDTRSTMRAAFNQKDGDPSLRAYGTSPTYVKELLISPYAEGGAFVQAWHRANPDQELAALMSNIPASSEQILHPEKYLSPDVPTAIDLSAIDGATPTGWDFFYATTLGEFDLLTLFSIHDETSSTAAEIAAGWDGLRLRAFEDHDGRIAILGSSVWDSDGDALEFYDGLSALLSETNEQEHFSVVSRGPVVDFVIGPPESDTRRDLLAALEDMARHDAP
jgi:hypothetical protein